MAVLRAKDVAKMDEKERKKKLTELKMELIKASVAANKTNAKTKEIKKAIARLLTVNNMTQTPTEKARAPTGKTRGDNKK